MWLTGICRSLSLAVAIGLCGWHAAARGEWIWIEGEKPTQSTMNRHPWWYDQVKTDQLSDGDFISNFSTEKAGEAEYGFSVRQAGGYDVWVRANPVQARLSYCLDPSDSDHGEWTEIDLGGQTVGNVNIAADGKPDLRFLTWAKAGRLELSRGRHTIRFRMDSANSNHGYLDCFVLTSEPFQPQGTLKPDAVAEAMRQAARENDGWVPFQPSDDAFQDSAGLDLRSLNEQVAGEHGFIGVKDGEFVHQATGQPIRFWGVNGPSAKDREGLQREARLLAKRGVNLVRLHGGYFDQNGDVKMTSVRHAQEVVETMKAEGIYTHLSIYFPLWLTPPADADWLAGYNGQQHPFAALFFNPQFQEKYRQWWSALLLTPSESTGKRLIDEPAVAGLEMQNEDSFLFWTFSEQNIPDPQLRLVETLFAQWLVQQYGSLPATLEKWGGQSLPRDNVQEGRIGFRPLWNMFQEKTQRDKDTVRFLVELQRQFYETTNRFLRELGFQGVITASNWTTASPEVFGPLEKYSYTVGDFIDRHGYFSCHSRGDNSEWSVRDGHTYADRSALRFDPEEPGKAKAFVHPAMDVRYNNLPSMISETTWNRPNRYRSEAPLYLAVYGALQGGNAIVHFAQDGAMWTVKPGFFMQPWTLMSPAMMGQFPAAAVIYRQRLVEPGEVLAELNLNIDALFDLQGTPLPQDAAFDELRLKDVPQTTVLKPGNVIDPLIHYAGRTEVKFVTEDEPSRLQPLDKYIDRQKQTVMSTTREVLLDYGQGLMYVNAPAVQGVSGDLAAAGSVALRDIRVASSMELGHIVLISLDGQPLSTSRRMLLQVMSEEKANKFRTTSLPEGDKQIESIGQDPWLFKELQGTVRLRRGDAAQLKVTALDFNGYVQEAVGTADQIELRRDAIYYLIQP